MWDHCLQHAALSDLGLRRANNQDAMKVVLAGSQEAYHKRGHLFMVADGMGAHAAGELASKLATDTVALSYPKLLDRSPPEALASAVTEANAQIHRRGQDSPDFRGMGTTSTALLLLPQGAVVAHVGDSRAYRLRDDRIEQLTFDHSLVWELRAAGQLPDEGAEKVPKNVITRSLGPNAQVQVDLEGPFPIEPGDSFLLCSDGLSGQVDDDELGMILASMPPDEAVQVLVDLANLRGGPDNITVIVVRVTGPLVAEGADPRSVPEPGSPALRPVHPAIWAVLAVSALAGLGLAAMGQWPAALVGLGVAAISAIVALVQSYGNGEGNEVIGARLLGRGPHAACPATPNAEFVDRLGEITERLRALAKQEDWQMDWSRLNQLTDQSAAAKSAGEYPAAVRQSCEAVRFMMEQLRSRGDAASDSSIFG
jgi:protein phosphatase